MGVEATPKPSVAAEPPRRRAAGIGTLRWLNQGVYRGLQVSVTALMAPA